MKSEITYDEAALILECTPRHVRNLIGKNTALIQPIRYSQQVVRLPLDGVVKLKKHLRNIGLRRALTMKGNTP